MQKSNFVLVYSTLKQDELALIKSLLDEAKIQYYIRNETPHSSAADALFIDIMIVQDRVEEAKELLKEFISPHKK